MSEKTPSQIIVFQQRGSGEEKISGIEQYGHDLEFSDIISIDAELPEFIEAPAEYIPARLRGDLVLSFLKHPDLIGYLAEVCRARNLPLIAAGKKGVHGHTPFTCCGLGRHKELGEYGKQFGFPELTIELDDNGLVRHVEVRRGASCGATWEAIPQIIGLPVQEAMITYAREVQYLCLADPSAFDPISGKSAVHYAGHVHNAALKKAFAEPKK